ncbi:unnamed protein product [Pleuronectes platessa]|uniref:Uncharacterized protein n=1 Tax=Pleuronectes platessa TaxID=8262 RepID=A0A9N7TI41_PLEPL|nr:unnamed protein product [Pleuronectes platessa]
MSHIPLGVNSAGDMLEDISENSITWRLDSEVDAPKFENQSGGSVTDPVPVTMLSPPQELIIQKNRGSSENEQKKKKRDGGKGGGQRRDGGKTGACLKGWGLVKWRHLTHKNVQYTGYGSGV